MVLRLAFILAAGLLAALPRPAVAVELVMVEQHGCHYCEQWNSEIGEIYPKTQAGRFAPLRRAQIGGASPGAVAVARPVVFTPTFLIVDEGREIGRIEGYPGEDFFWWVLETKLAATTEFVQEPPCATC